MPEHTRTDCRTTEGITVGLIDSIITAARALAGRDKVDPAITAALADLRGDEDLRGLLAEPGVDQSANWVLGRVREALGTPPGRAVSVHAAEVRAERDQLSKRAASWWEAAKTLNRWGTAHRELHRSALAERDGARRERDLAVAHDRQPYPTAWAYEQACRALREKQARIDDVLAWLEDADGMELTRVGIDALRAKLQGDKPAEPDATPPDPSGRITDHGPVERFRDDDFADLTPTHPEVICGD